jgi:eukaryotic-like serine/threonine-protein kinase
MKPERWEQIARLHRAALERDESQRTAFVREACAGDEDLRREVESLLTYEREGEAFMESPALGPPLAVAVAPELKLPKSSYWRPWA